MIILTAQYDNIEVTIGQLLIPITDNSAQTDRFREESCDRDSRIDTIVAEGDRMLKLLKGHTVQIIDGNVVTLE